MAPEMRRRVLGDAGCVIAPLPDDSDGRPDISAALRYMGMRGINHALVEAGTGLVTSFLAAWRMGFSKGAALSHTGCERRKEARARHSLFNPESSIIQG